MLEKGGEKMKKAVISIVAIILLVSCVVIPVSAAETEAIIQPRWSIISNIDCTLTVIDGEGHADCVSSAQVGATSVQTDIYVYEYTGNEWVYVTEKHDIKYKIVSGVCCTFPARSDGYYCAVYTFTMVKNGVSESVDRIVYYNV